MPHLGSPIDESTPIAWQLLGGAFQVPGLGGQGWLGQVDAAAYQHWVFDTRGLKTPMLLGGHLEVFTRTTPLLLLLHWLPVVALCLSAHARTPHPLLHMALGFLTWSFLEHWLHRHVFHHQPTTNLGAMLHFVLHGIHHHFPQDHLRLLFPPIPGLLVAGGMLLLLQLLLPPAAAQCLVGGGAVGYLCYDLCHYALHHISLAPTSTTSRLFLRLQQLHKVHHMEHTHTFGVSPMGACWDYVFHTTPPLPGK